MNSSDNSTRTEGAGWVAAGVGMNATFRCAACDKPSSLFGSKVRRVLGLRQKCCGPCAGRIDKARDL